MLGHTQTIWSLLLQEWKLTAVRVYMTISLPVLHVLEAWSPV